MTDEYVDETLEDDEDQPIKVNFTGVAGQRAFHLLPRGKYIATVTDYTKSTVSDASDNAGAEMINWEYTVECTYPKLETEVVARVRTQEPGTRNVHVSEEVIKVEGRRLYDNMVIIESSYWRMKAFLEAMWFDASGEMDIWPAEIVEAGIRMVLEVGIQKAKKNRETGETYKERNVIRAFHPLPEEKPAQPEPTPSVAAEEVSAEEENAGTKKSKAKAEKSEEAKV